MKQYQTLQRMLREYTLAQLTRYENEFVQLNNNTPYRKADPLDHLEMIMAQTRLETAERIFDDLRFILDISQGR